MDPQVSLVHMYSGDVYVFYYNYFQKSSSSALVLLSRPIALRSRRGSTSGPHALQHKSSSQPPTIYSQRTRWGLGLGWTTFRVSTVWSKQWRSVWPTIAQFHHRTEDSLQVTVSPDRLLAVGLVLWTSTGFHEDGSEFERPGRRRRWSRAQA